MRFLFWLSVLFRYRFDCYRFLFVFFAIKLSIVNFSSLSLIPFTSSCVTFFINPYAISDVLPNIISAGIKLWKRTSRLFMQDKILSMLRPQIIFALGPLSSTLYIQLFNDNWSWYSLSLCVTGLMVDEVKSFMATATILTAFGPADLLLIDHDETIASASCTLSEVVDLNLTI